MTFAPDSLLEVRHEFQQRTHQPNNALGIVGDTEHNAKGSSYHLGKSMLRSDSYSITESPRDRAGLSEASAAIDIGWFSITVHDKTHNLRTFSRWLVGQCEAEASDTLDIREIIWSPDGKVVKRWDRLKRRSSGDDSHLTHTHADWFRDSENRDRAAVIRRYFREVVEGDDVSQADVIAALKTPEVKALIAAAAGSGVHDQRLGKSGVTIGQALQNAGIQLRDLTGKDHTDEPAIVAGVLAGLDPKAIAAAIPADLAQRVADELAARLAA